jgi:hypothetical protein
MQALTRGNREKPRARTRGQRVLFRSFGRQFPKSFPRKGESRDQNWDRNRSPDLVASAYLVDQFTTCTVLGDRMTIIQIYFWLLLKSLCTNR